MRKPTKNWAVSIAQSFVECEIEHRGDLMLMIANELRNNGQGYTASLFEIAAHTYGTNRTGDR